MAVKTGAIFKELYFDEQSSGDYGVYISGAGTFNAPAPEIEMVSIPGRNGDLALDKGRFENIEVTYKAGLFGVDEADFANAISDFRNFLCSRKGYVRLEDDYNPDEYRMAVYKDGLDVDAKQLKAGEFDIVFNCKPQRWLKSGEEVVTIGEWGETETVTGEIVTIDAAETDAVKSLNVALSPIQDLNGYDAPWVGGAGKNKLLNNAQSGSKNGVTYTVNDGVISCSGNATSTVEIEISLTVALTNNDYILNGCPLGGSGSKYKIDIPNAGYATDTGRGVTFTANDSTSYRVRIVIYTGYGDGLVFKPMVRLASETDATYEPYENICPISGHDSVETTRAGKNLLPSTPQYTSTAVSFDITKCARLIKDRQYKFSFASMTNASSWRILFTLFDLDGNKVEASSTSLTITTSGAFTACDKTLYWNSSFKAFIQGANGTDKDVLFTPANDYYLHISFSIGDTSVTTVMNEPQLELGTEATAYEPYQGETYTNNLGQTVYGGTLDVVSGELVDKIGNITFDGSNDEAWSVNASGNRTIRFAVPLPSAVNVTNADTSVRCITNELDCLSASVAITAQDATAAHFACAVISNQRLYVMLPKASFADVAALRTWLANNPLQVVYELAEPQTYTLTAQQVALLMGTNNVWSDAGEIMLEYGQNPNYLINPTLFDASSLLEVEGYGTIGFNGYSVEINDDIFGYIHVSEPVEVAPSGYGSVNLYAGIDLNSELLNEGDSLDIDELSLGVTYRPVITIVGSPTVAVTYSDGTPYDKDYEVTTERVGSASSNRRRTRVIFKNIGSLAYLSGSGPEINLKVVITGSASSDAEWVTGYDLSVSTSSNRPVVNINAMVTGGTNMAESKLTTARISAVTGYSTVSVLGHPTYVDCEAGEGYRELGSGYMSLNRYIDLGSDLPKLGPGPNEVTRDDTITELKVLPRWWKV